MQKYGRDSVKAGVVLHILLTQKDTPDIEILPRLVTVTVYPPLTHGGIRQLFWGIILLK